MNENPASTVHFLCWVCEERVSNIEYFNDGSGLMKVVHDWCLAGAETKTRRLAAEEGQI